MMAVYLWAYRRDVRPRGGAHQFKIDQEMRDELVRILDGNTLLALVDINTELRRCLPQKPATSTSTLVRTLDGMLMTI